MKNWSYKTGDICVCVGNSLDKYKKNFFSEDINLMLLLEDMPFENLSEIKEFISVC